jgi:hypothetical protein
MAVCSICTAAAAAATVPQGLVQYDSDIDEVSVLTNRVSITSAFDPDSEVTYANDLAIASDGRVFFTSCSDIVPTRSPEGYYDTFKAWMLGLAQVCGSGIGFAIRCLWVLGWLKKQQVDKSLQLLKSDVLFCHQLHCNVRLNQHPPALDLYLRVSLLLVMFAGSAQGAPDGV